MTRLCVPITAPSVEAMLRDAQTAVRAGADMVELRLDYLGADQVSQTGYLVEKLVAQNVPLIATCRIAAEGGRFDGDDALRIPVYEDALKAGADAIDVELASWTRCKPLRERLWAALDATAGQPRRLFDDGAAQILSVHDFQATPPRFDPILAEMLNTPVDILKIAFQANSILDSIRVLDALYQWRNVMPTIALAMGETGILTRVLAKKLGAFLTFASLEEGKQSAPGQPTIGQMKTLYRWDRLGEKTRVYGVVGCPVAHSMSPALHNAAFDATGHDGIYLPMRVEPAYEHFQVFLDAVLERPWLDLAGLSVTIPHKENLLRCVRDHLDRGGPDCGSIEPLAARIGVANTLVISRHEGSRTRSASEGFVHEASEQASAARIEDLPPAPPSESGNRKSIRNPKLDVFNTDYAGALDALTAGMGITRDDLKDMRIAVLGAGGAAKAIIAGLRDAGAVVYIYNRTNSKARALAAQFGAVAMPWESRNQMMCEIIINCTSVGMWPGVSETPLEKENIPPNSIVFDTVYNPVETRLLREARARNGSTIDGVAMFVAQAARQFRLWTNIEPPVDLMHQVVIQRLTQKEK